MKAAHTTTNAARDAGHLSKETFIAALVAKGFSGTPYIELDADPAHHKQPTPQAFWVRLDHPHLKIKHLPDGDHNDHYGTTLYGHLTKAAADAAVAKQPKDGYYTARRITSEEADRIRRIKMQYRLAAIQHADLEKPDFQGEWD